MDFKSKLQLPQKSVFGFKVLSSFHSSITCYIFFLIGKILNPLFGLSQIQIITGSLFHILLNLSILILIINLIAKRKELEIFNFIFLNSLLFIYLPIALHDIAKYTKILLFF